MSHKRGKDTVMHDEKEGGDTIENDGKEGEKTSANDRKAGEDAVTRDEKGGEDVATKDKPVTKQVDIQTAEDNTIYSTGALPNLFSRVADFVRQHDRVVRKDELFNLERSSIKRQVAIILTDDKNFVDLMERLITCVNLHCTLRDRKVSQNARKPVSATILLWQIVGLETRKSLEIPNRPPLEGSGRNGMIITPLARTSTGFVEEDIRYIVRKIPA